MNYEDDELERMRARHEGRSNVSQSGRSSRSASGTSRRRTAGTAESRSSQHNTAGKSSGTARSGYSSSKDTGSTKKSSAKKGRYRRKSARRKKYIIIAAEILVILMMVLGGVFWYVYHKTFGSMQKIEFDEDQVKNLSLSEEQIEEMKGYMTVACFGVDSRSEHGKMNVGKGTNSDVNIIANINLETGEIRLVSVFRDSYLNINDKNSYNKINAAYAQGGPEQAVKALNKNLGLNITEYATFNWKAVADAINILGGVDVELSDAEFSWINAFVTETVKETGIASVPVAHSGNVHLDGVQAVAYGRIRYSDTDYARTERQRIIIQKAFEKAKKADWATLNCILETIMPQLATNLSISDLVPLARSITKFHIGETMGFPAARGEQDVGKIGDCVIPQTLEYNVVELHKFLFDEEDYEVPSNVKEYSNHIAQVTGLTKNAKLIGHVPVDQGVSATSFIKKRASRIAAQAAAQAAEKKAAASQTTDESEGESKDESKSGESESSIGLDEIFDPDEDWIDSDDETKSSKETSSKESTAAVSPGNTGKNSSTATTEAANSSSGPGSNTSETKTSVVKPGSTATTEAEVSSPNGKTSPGSSDSSGVKSPITDIQEQESSGNTSSSNGPAGPGA